MIFNLRIWKIHFQVQRVWRISFYFAWFDFWVGLYVDKKKQRYFLQPILPMFGMKTEGVWIHWNSHYSFKNDPFIWLFNYGDKYYPMRDYHNNQGGKNNGQ